MIRVTGTVAFDVVGRTAALPGPNVTTRIDLLARDYGGAAGNVAMGLARLGSRVQLAAVVGDDFAGSTYEASLIDAGVDLGGLVRAPGPTAHAFMFCDPEGHQQIYFYPGPGVPLASAPHPPPGGLAHFTTGDPVGYVERMRLADRVTFDPGQELFHRDVKAFEACFPHVDVLFLNEHEAAYVLKHLRLTPEDILALGVEVVGVTYGKDGQRIITREGSFRVPAAPARAVDPTGAGDAHRAGFLLGMEHGLPWEACARIGAITSAFAVEGLGPQKGLPTLAQVRKRYEDVFGEFPLRGA